MLRWQGKYSLKYGPAKYRIISRRRSALAALTSRQPVVITHFTWWRASHFCVATLFLLTCPNLAEDEFICILALRLVLIRDLRGWGFYLALHTHSQTSHPGPPIFGALYLYDFVPFSFNVLWITYAYRVWMPTPRSCINNPLFNG